MSDMRFKAFLLLLYKGLQPQALSLPRILIPRRRTRSTPLPSLMKCLVLGQILCLFLALGLFPPDIDFSCSK